MDKDDASEVTKSKVKQPRKVTPEAMSRLRELAPSHCTVELAKILGLNQATITYLCYKYDITLGKHNPEDCRLLTRVPKDVAKIYRKQAEIRNISMSALVYRLLTNIARDMIFDAVLEEDKPCRKPLKDL